MKQYQGDTTLCGAGVDKNFAWLIDLISCETIVRFFF
jgi:hypothetical protein